VASHRHKRDTDARLLARRPRAAFVAGPLALAATLSTVGVGVWAADSDTRDLLASSSRGSVQHAVSYEDRPQVVSRSGGSIEREEPWEDLLAAPAVERAVRTADTKLWTTAPLNLWTTPGDDAAKQGVLDAAKKVLVTGREAAGRVEVVIDGRARWVTAGYLTDDDPDADTGSEADSGSDADSAAPALGGTCTNGSAVEGQPNVLAVHEAVCAAFPEITSYGTYRSDGEHAQGLAIDIMVSGSRGWEVAEFVRANYAELGVSYIMYAQRIWSVERAGEGWRYVEDRGSVTANHYDHVHVTTY
jgi:hypothetical protein